MGLQLLPTGLVIGSVQTYLEISSAGLKHALLLLLQSLQSVSLLGCVLGEGVCSTLVCRCVVHFHLSDREICTAHILQLHGVRVSLFLPESVLCR